MTVSDHQADDRSGTSEPDLQEPWRPVWEEDEAAEPLPPSWIIAPSSCGPAGRVPDPRRLLAPLAAAEDALSRLDAGAEAASGPVREGLVARLAFAEAAGWLAGAADRAWIHPRDLALAEAGLLGDFAAAAIGDRAAETMPATAASLGGPGRAGAILAAEADRLPDGIDLARGLALARALRRLATMASWDPLADPAAALRPLLADPAAALRLHPERLTAWRQGALDRSLPPLLAAAAAAATWMRDGVAENGAPGPAGALLLAAAVARRRGRTRAVPLPVWSMPPGHRPPVLPLQDPAAWPGTFLERVAAGARHGLGALARLREAEATAARLAAGGRRGLLPAATVAALRAPAVTARGLAGQLGITPQGALLLLKRLQAAGVVREATGRRSFRAYVIW